MTEQTQLVAMTDREMAQAEGGRGGAGNDTLLGNRGNDVVLGNPSARKAFDEVIIHFITH